MTKVFGLTGALFVAFAALTLFAASVANAQPCCEPFANELKFVANHDELYFALEAAEKGTIGSVAISQNYYKEGTSRVQKNQIRGLMETVLKIGSSRSVYIYGSPLDATLGSELMDVDMLRCEPAYALVKNAYAVGCFGAPRSNVVMTEERIRERLRQHDTRKQRNIR